MQPGCGYSKAEMPIIGAFPTYSLLLVCKPVPDLLSKPYRTLRLRTQVIENQKKVLAAQGDETDTLDAFVALGGEVSTKLTLYFSLLRVDGHRNQFPSFTTSKDLPLNPRQSSESACQLTIVAWFYRNCTLCKTPKVVHDSWPSICFSILSGGKLQQDNFQKPKGRTSAVSSPAGQQEWPDIY